MTDQELSRLRGALADGHAPASFSFWDFLAGRGHEIELALAYGKAFWPELIEVEDYILLAEHYDDEYFQRVQRDVGASQLEATINTTYLRNLFGDEDADDAVWETLGELLTKSWKARAVAMFPQRRFCSRFAWYSDMGDPGITLHQERP